MEGVRTSTVEPQAFALGEALVTVEVDLSIYSRRSILRSCYKFTSRCYVFLSRTEDADWLVVAFLAKSQGEIPAALIGEFYNELLDQQIRENLDLEMGPVRELIVAQAFAEGNLLDPLRDEGNYEDDPLGIGKR
jgi:His-Xaa-Ser system protein HxsD